MPRLTFSARERRFLELAAATLIPSAATSATGIDVLMNLERMLSHASTHHRRRVVRLVAWSYRVSWLYGGRCMPIQARRSRFISIQRLAHALSSLCLIAFWGDQAARKIVGRPRSPV